MKHVLSVICMTSLGLGILSGCNSSLRSNPVFSSSEESVTFDAIIANLTPELATLAEREIDISRHRAVNANVMARMLREDWTHVWYTDHPSRLTTYPIMYTSGQPR